MAFFANIVLWFWVRDFAFNLADDTWKNLMENVKKHIESKTGGTVEPFDKNNEYGKRYDYNESDCID